MIFVDEKGQKITVLDDSRQWSIGVDRVNMLANSNTYRIYAREIDKIPENTIPLSYYDTQDEAENGFLSIAEAISYGDKYVYL